MKRSKVKVTWLRKTSGRTLPVKRAAGVGLHVGRTARVSDGVLAAGV